MALESINNKKDEQEAFSLNQLDPSFYYKIMSRNSSVGRSSTYQDSDVKIPLDWEVQPGKPRYDRLDAPSTSHVVWERVKSQKYYFDKKIEERSSRTNSSASASDEFIKDFEFVNLDVGETIMSSSPSRSRSSPPLMRSPTCSIKPPKSRFQYVARGLVKWVLAAKPSKDTK
ncbi:unnamed protein product [Dovyalis caffra]|uniref:Uncharacterized protein n=1 Tax=Dovyalis caffra TaxID=77055 RepID=A0AAV1RNY4_9ROSI|nr:unnamed protein product [Dovyalis caffra]